MLNLLTAKEPQPKYVIEMIVMLVCDVVERFRL